MYTLRAFLLGMTEFRCAFTAAFTDDALNDAYDRGRDFAHRLTLRRYED